MLPLLLACKDGDDPADPRWSAGADLPAPQQECGVAALDGRVVVVGGFDDTLAVLDRVLAYDPDADAWEALAPLPEPVHHANVAVLDGELHVAGALAGGFVEVGVHWRYDAGDDGWTVLPDLPPDRAVGGAGAAAVGGRLHLVGGLRGGASVALHSVWDPATLAWEALPDAPTARDHHVVVAAGDRLVVTGGRDGGLSAFRDATDVWDGTWRAGAALPTPRGGLAAALDDAGLVHVVGGEGDPDDPDGVFGDHEVYDPATDTWTTELAMLTPRHGTGAAWVGGTLWVPGGATVEGFGAVATNEGWTP